MTTIAKTKADMAARVSSRSTPLASVKTKLLLTFAGPYDYDQIPALVERSMLRVKNFYADLDGRLAALPFGAGDHFSAADITGFVTVDFATKAMSSAVPDEHKALRRWFEKVSSRPSAAG